MNTSYSNTNINTTTLSSITLSQLGWKGFFQQQLSLDELEASIIGRVVAHHRSGYQVQLETEKIHLAITKNLPSLTVGDWLLLDENNQLIRLLERSSLLSRKAAGSKVEEQLIAANIDTMFIVCSLNDDFNLNRIERYLVIANEAKVEAVIVLSKCDLVDNFQQQLGQVQKLDPYLPIFAVNTMDATSIEPLKAWCKQGNTLTFLGSSGVGKSTLVNTLLGDAIQLTSGIREDDSKGRHTTTSRSLHFMPNGSLLLDTPGMREIQLAECADGVEQTFAEVELLVSQCRFNNCSHQNEPGCAIRAALESGELERRRFDNFLKLKAEQSRNSASLQEKRAKDKALSKMYKDVQSGARMQKKGY